MLSLRLIIVAVVLLFIARLSGVVIQYSSIRMSAVFGLSYASLMLVLNVIEDFTDTMGVLSLVVGFVETIKFERAEEERIRALEGLLPICSNCKKYRTPENTWLPIEHYLTNVGDTRLTHSLCPNCARELYGAQAAEAFFQGKKGS